MDEQEKTKRLLDIEEASKDYRNNNVSYIRNVTTIAVGLLGLLVTLKPDHINNQSAQYLFIISISLLGVGIISSCASQFREVTDSQWKVKVLRDKLISKLKNDDTGKKSPLHYLKKSLVYKVSDLATLICYSLSVITLVLYIWFSELNLVFIFLK